MRQSPPPPPPLPQPLQQSLTLLQSRPRQPRFPPQSDKFPGFILDTDKNRMQKYLSLSDKLKKQLLKIEIFATYWKPGLRYLLLEIFDEFYDLQEEYKDADLEGEQVECLKRIIGNSTLPLDEKNSFMLVFASTLNDDTIYKYCREISKHFFTL